MSKNRSLVRNLIAVGMAAAMVAACGGPPEMPPADTMEFELFKQDPAANGLTSADQATTNVEIAAAAVWLVSTTVWLALAVPRATFAGTISTKAERDGDEWVWKKKFALIAWEAELRGRAENETVYAEMYITDLRAGRTGVDNFLWYTGEHKAGQGTWQFFDPAVTSGAVLEIDWTREAADDKDLVFTNVNEDAAATKKGDSLSYGLHGTTASMVIHDAHEGIDDSGGPIDISVEWDIETGAGKYTDRDGNAHCWDTLSNGQVDIPCP